MLVWLLEGGFVPPLLIGVGVFFTFYLKGQPLRSPKRMLWALTRPAPPQNGRRGVSPLGAMSLALAGTLGVGNIVGVANALWIGGAGAIFWMWVCALFAMILKYAEITLAVSHRRVREDGGFFGGAVYYIRDCSTARRTVGVGKVIACVFAALMIVDALSMGCVIQVNAVSSAFAGVWGIPRWASGLLLLCLSLPVLRFGTRGATRLTEILVPVMSVGYIVLSLAVLILCRRELPQALSLILRDAFAPKSALGGFFGFLTSSALRTGAMRGLLSNEAGCGTAPTAHAASNARTPAEQGIWGIFEVFVDTVLLCSATALVLLVNWEQVQSFGSDGVMMSIRAYSSVLGSWAEGFFGIAILCFGYATVICWGQYGLECLQFLTKKKGYAVAYLISVGACILIGAMAPPAKIWGIADASLAALTLINLAVLLLMRKEIKAHTEAFLSDFPPKR